MDSLSRSPRHNQHSLTLLHQSLGVPLPVSIDIVLKFSGSTPFQVSKNITYTFALVSYGERG
jgi:hypothetical protein